MSDACRYLDGLHARIKALETQLQDTQSSRTGEKLSIHDNAEEGSLDPLFENPLPDPEMPPPASPASHSQVPGETSVIHRRLDSEDLTNTLVASEPQIKVHRYGHPGTFLLCAQDNCSAHLHSISWAQLDSQFQPKRTQPSSTIITYRRPRKCIRGTPGHILRDEPTTDCA